ncbi:hypothetical protein [uncultured Roseobacter sp.]|uniref:hypothetical protein n=1 Tax=uncultured Roseobacter sp. TaxID=114847 RepID=UPI00260DD8CA|nr:hypothetical protein [uncultured Roseobacter sp.]
MSGFPLQLIFLKFSILDSLSLFFMQICGGSNARKDYFQGRYKHIGENPRRLRILLMPFSVANSPAISRCATLALRRNKSGTAGRHSVAVAKALPY